MISLPSAPTTTMTSEETLTESVSALAKWAESAEDVEKGRELRIWRQGIGGQRELRIWRRGIGGQRELRIWRQGIGGQRELRI